jgi:hypothetical protein
VGVRGGVGCSDDVVCVLHVDLVLSISHVVVRRSLWSRVILEQGKDRRAQRASDHSISSPWVDQNAQAQLSCYKAYILWKIFVTEDKWTPNTCISWVNFAIRLLVGRGWSKFKLGEIEESTFYYFLKFNHTILQIFSFFPLEAA